MLDQAVKTVKQFVQDIISQSQSTPVIGDPLLPYNHIWEEKKSPYFLSVRGFNEALKCADSKAMIDSPPSLCSL